MSDFAVLWGRDHTELGAISVRSPSPTTALAISKGLEPKPYLHIDPNEDAVGVVVADGGDLLVCADGHNGFDSVRLAVTVVVERLGDQPLEDVSTERIVSAFEDAHEAVLKMSADEACANPESQTTLVVAALSGRVLRWVTMGDSALFVASPGTVERLDEPEAHFLGWPDMTRDQVEEWAALGESELEPGGWVILATDGFVDFASDDTPYESAEDAVWAACEDAVNSADVARRLVEIAFDGGAADNVGVVVAGPVA
jgi:serine/threonine protein phosphatase PrpC